jgi:Fur family ferric uptake transcriptional regulator
MVTTPRRATSQRSALQAVLDGTDEFATAADLHESLRASGARVGLATVYRTLADLVAAGDIDSLRGPAGETLYRRCGDAEHHHHLVCRICGRTEEVTAPAVERWAKAVAKHYGFSDIDHEIELFGVCAACAATDAATGAASGTGPASAPRPDAAPHSEPVARHDPAARPEPVAT